LVVNLAGCFAIAATMHAAMALSWSPTVRSAITIGFIGGLTTYSSFNYETSRLLEEGAIGAAMLNAAATIVGAFGAGWLGMVSARLLLGR
jgi:CrcB protein